MINLSEIDKAYIAGFLDADGSIISQIVKAEKYKYGFSLRLSIVFYQKSDKHWFLMQLKDKLKYGTLRKRKDGISEYVIVSAEPVKYILKLLQPYLIIKKGLAKHVLKIIEYKKNINDKNEFIEVCKLVDETKNMTYSKKRSITSEEVIKFLI